MIPVRTFFAALAFLVTLTAPAVISAQDYEREQRWRTEVEPALVVGNAVQIPGPDNRAFLGLLTEPPGTQRGAATLLVIVHGVGVHPDHGVIGRLRMDLVDKGFATLSIQMPVLSSDAAPEQYAPLFDNAATRIGAAAAWARQQGFRDLALVSHSLGSRMANAYFDRATPPAYRAWVALGLGGAFTPSFAKSPPVPVFDVYGAQDLPPVMSNAAARAQTATASGGRQQMLAGANHFYAGREAELVELIAAFAKRP